MKRLILFPFLLSAFSFVLITGCDPNMGCCITSVLTTSPATLSFLGSGGSQTIDLSIPMAWKIVKPSNFPSWITVTPEFGNGSINITITIAPNLNVQSRSFPLIFLAVNGDKAQVMVNQAASVLNTVKAVIMTVTPYGSISGATEVTDFGVTQAQLDALVTLNANYVIDGYYTTDDPTGTKVAFPVGSDVTLYVRLNGDGSTILRQMEIYSADDLAALSSRVNGGMEPDGLYYRLGANIDLSAHLSPTGAGYNGGNGWIPIGIGTSRFKGFFEGDHLMVSGLFINVTTNNVGLFGVVEDAKIENLDVTIASGGISGDTAVGGMAGAAYNSLVDNCHVTGSVSGNDRVGGLVGYAGNSSAITDSSFDGVAEGVTNVGGLAGHLSASSITKCYTNGDVKGPWVNPFDSQTVGGIAGLVILYSTVSESYSTSAVDGGNIVGGVAGSVQLGSALNNCYATGSVTGYFRVGGVAGQVSDTFDPCLVAYCYATGAVEGWQFVGGIVGEIWEDCVNDCAALNVSVGNHSDLGRVAGHIQVGLISGNTILFNNVAWDLMSLIGWTIGTVGHDEADGADISKADATSAAFWTTPTATWTGWNATIWDFTNGLPTLINVGGDQLSNNPPLHLQ